MTNNKNQLIRTFQPQKNLELLTTLPQKIQCSREAYLNGKGTKFKTIPFEIHSIGEIAKAEHAGESKLFIQIFFYTKDYKNLFSCYIPFQELARQTQSNQKKFATSSAQEIIYLRVINQPIKKIINNRIYFIFQLGNKKYQVSAIELARALLFLNQDIMNVCFLPNALEHLCILDEDSTHNKIFFDDNFFSRKNLDHLQNKIKISWLITNEEARKSFMSIYISCIENKTSIQQFNFTPPPLENCQIKLFGRWDKKKPDLFHMNLIERIELQFYQNTKRVTLSHPAQENQPAIIKKFTEKPSNHFSDEHFSYFYDLITQLTALYEYSIKTVTFNEITDEIMSASYYFCYRNGLKTPRQAFFNLKEKHSKKYFQAEIKHQGRLIYLLAIPLNVNTPNARIRVMLLSLPNGSENQFELLKNDIFEGGFTETKIKYDFCYRYLYMRIPKNANCYLKNSKFSEILHEKINYCFDYAKSLNDKEKVITDFATSSLDDNYLIVIFESIILPACYSSEDEQFCFHKKPLYAQPESMHFAIGINQEGEKKLLGLWVYDSTFSEEIFWKNCIYELKLRGLKTIKLAYMNSSYQRPTKAVIDIFQDTCIEHRSVFAQRYSYKSHHNHPLYEAFHLTLTTISKCKSIAQINTEIGKLWNKIKLDKIANKEIKKIDFCDFFNTLCSDSLLFQTYISINKDIVSILDVIMSESKKFHTYDANGYLISQLYRCITKNLSDSISLKINWLKRREKFLKKYSKKQLHNQLKEEIPIS